MHRNTSSDQAFLTEFIKNGQIKVINENSNYMSEINVPNSSVSFQWHG